MPDKPTRRERERLRGRTSARLAAVQALYQSETAGIPADRVIDEFLRHRLQQEGDRVEAMLEAPAVPPAEALLFETVVRGAERDREAIDAIITRHLTTDWQLERIDPVLRALLRAAVGELRDPKAAPARVVINEYLDVAHSFFGPEAKGLANGVLDHAARGLRSAEFEA